MRINRLHALSGMLIAFFGLNVVAKDADAQTAWWPTNRAMAIAGSIGLAADRDGGFLLVDSGGRVSGGTYYCGPNGETTSKTYPAQIVPSPGEAPHTELGSTVPGSPSFTEDGSSLVLSLSKRGTISQSVLASEGAASTPQILGTAIETLSSGSIGGPRYLVAATGPNGDTAVAGLVKEVYDVLQVATRTRNGTWNVRPLEGYGTSPIALAVDGAGDVILLDQVYESTKPGKLGNAYFASPNSPFEPVSIPGTYFSSVSASTTGAEAIAGFTTEGPEGPGIYLSKRETPSQAFSQPVLVARTTESQTPDLAYDDNGDLTVAWTASGAVDIAVAHPYAHLEGIQAIFTPEASIASDLRLSVDASGEAVLAWAAGAHEFIAPSLPVEGLRGMPASIYASVRRAALGGFDTPQRLTTDAVYAEAVNQRKQEEEGVRVLDAIGAGRALVAWPTEEAGVPGIDFARYAATNGCLPSSSSRPVVPAKRVKLQIRWTHRLHTHDGVVRVGSLRCPSNCRVTTTLVTLQDSIVARASHRVRSHGWLELNASLTRYGIRLRKRSSITVIARVHITGAGLSSFKHHRFRGKL